MRVIGRYGPAPRLDGTARRGRKLDQAMGECSPQARLVESANGVLRHLADKRDGRGKYGLRHLLREVTTGSD
jgi:hypothetical protein